MRATLRFSQLTTAGGILAGAVRRRNVRSCDRCGALVPLNALPVHTRWHAEQAGDLIGYRIDPGQCENNGDRIVTVVDDVAEVKAS